MDSKLSKECTKVPLSADCIAACVEYLFANASSLEMQLILGFDAVISTKIQNGYIYGKGELGIIRKELSDEQLGIVIDALKKMNQVQMNYFLLEGEVRENILTAIRKLGLSLNMDFPENYSYGGGWP